MKNVLDTITSYREARHWSNYDLASHAGIKPTTISTWYSKNIMPTLPTLVKVCDAFGITLTEFFSVVESGEREPVVLTHEQAEMLEKWSALRPEQKEAVVHLLSTMPYTCVFSLLSWIATGIFPFTIMEDCTVHSPCSAP